MTSRPSRQVRRRRFLASLFGLYLVVLAFIAFWPSPIDSGSAGLTLRNVLAWLQGQGAPGWFNYNFVEFTANILLFVPFGFLGAAYLDRHEAWRAVVIGVVMSISIEALQQVFLEYRFSSIKDIAANSIGCTLGFVLCSSIIHKRSMWTPNSR